MPGLVVWSCLIYLTRINHCHPLPPRWPWRWIGPRSGATATPKVPACFNKTSSSSSSTCCDETNGMVKLHLRVSARLDIGQSTRPLGAEKPRLSSTSTTNFEQPRTKVTTRLLPLLGKQTKPPSSPVRRVASAGQTETLADLQC